MEKTIDCSELAYAGMWTRSGSPVMTICGQYVGGIIRLCPECDKQASIAYPQGWKVYPGDTCRHGVYTGGCGVDRMCFRCEQGICDRCDTERCPGGWTCMENRADAMRRRISYNVAQVAKRAGFAAMIYEITTPCARPITEADIAAVNELAAATFPLA